MTLNKNNEFKTSCIKGLSTLEQILIEQYVPKDLSTMDYTDSEGIDNRQINIFVDDEGTAKKYLLSDLAKKDYVDKELANKCLWETGPGKYSIQSKNTGCLSYGDYSVAEGTMTVAHGLQSHAEGINSTAGGDRSHAEGLETYANAVASHSEGDHTLASVRAECAHVEGDNTVADNIGEHAEGRFNLSNHNEDSVGFGDKGNTLHSVGIGTGNYTALRKNAFEIMQNGDQYTIGIGGYTGQNIDTAKTVQEVINSKQDKIIVCTQEQYDLLPSSNNGIFFIVEKFAKGQEVIKILYGKA